ncbi:MFS transporter [Streptomyces sp. ISL-22]|uniref:MDR family MFS transporter n=1 Tax=unclassified Streptomyces TaxID=2593676 RepID=UPI001BEA6BEA|nr:MULTISPECIES: MFS transporter [unclassified Streptomyces]MBT2420968.1 MFS transporter [Streptomyces sp. ISL-24]MBT2435394.1 MFS transporter [Streptomyces sp. ISL-22]
MSTEQSGASDPPFRETLRELPARVWIVSLGILVNRCGNFLPVFIVLYLTSQGYSPGAAGLVLGSAGLGNVLGSALGGYLADRLGRRWTIALSGVTTAALTAVIPVLDTLAMNIVVVGLVGTASQLYRPAAAALLTDCVTTNQQRVAAFAVFRFAMNLGAAAGGFLGGWLAANSYTELFLGNAAACLLFGVIAVLLLRDVPHGASDEREDTSGPTEQGSYRLALADRRLRRFLLMTVVAELVYIQSTVGLPLHVTSSGLTEADFGLLIGLNGVLVLVCELPIAGLVVKRRATHVLAWGNLATGVGLALTGFATDMIWLAATVVLWSIGEMMYSSVANAYLGGLSPAGMVGRYQGLYSAAFTLGTGVGPLIGAAIYAYNEWALWAAIGIAGLISAQLCLPSRRSPAPPVAEGADGDAGARREGGAGDADGESGEPPQPSGRTGKRGPGADEASA